jgi:NAD(P)-dependent dehydrogenase (short-subunit alcohol dehydrogenase family)
MRPHTTLDGKIVLVTGATGGLGPAVARGIAAAGAHLALAAGDLARVAALAGEIGDARGFAADLTDERSTAELALQVAEHVGEIDALVHLVGGYASGTTWGSDLATWERMLSLNLRSALLAIRAVLPGMLARGRGKIVAVGSRAAFEPAAGMAAYAVSKAALLKLVETLAAEVVDRGVQVNAIAPSIIDTTANRRAMPRADFSKWVTPEDLARTVVFLLLNDAVSGDVVKVYGRA